ncbi:MAG: hypothetical protein E6084_00690 [Peptoniphilus harei]|nr:hypothetical protein [Peptoniphilus harei]
MNISKETKQKNLFATICYLAADSKEVESISGEKYKEVILRIKPENIEEIREWSKEPVEETNEVEE